MIRAITRTSHPDVFDNLPTVFSSQECTDIVAWSRGRWSWRVQFFATAWLRFCFDRGAEDGRTDVINCQESITPLHNHMLESWSVQIAEGKPITVVQEDYLIW